MHAFWLVLTYDLVEDRRIDDVIDIKTFALRLMCHIFALTTFWRYIGVSLLNRRTATWNLKRDSRSHEVSPYLFSLDFQVKPETHLGSCFTYNVIFEITKVILLCTL